MFNSLKSYIKNYTGFSEDETKAAIILNILIIILLIFRLGNCFYIKSIKNKALPIQALSKSNIYGIYDINKINETQIEKLGFAPYLAKRIIKYRSLLGGFINVSQLEEIYGISQKKLTLLKNHTIVHNNYRPKVININQASYKQMIIHPYFSKIFLKKIFKLRRQKKIQYKDLVKMKIRNLKKIVKYIDF